MQNLDQTSKSNSKLGALGIVVLAIAAAAVVLLLGMLRPTSALAESSQPANTSWQCAQAQCLSQGAAGNAANCNPNNCSTNGCGSVCAR